MAEPDPTASLQAALRTAQASLERALDRVLTAAGLTASQYELATLLAAEGPLPLKQVAARLGVAPGNVTCVVDNLVRSGLVEKRQDPGDRRITRAVLTPEGRARLEALAPCYAAARAALLAGLTIDEQEILTRLLRKLGTSASQRV